MNHLIKTIRSDRGKFFADLLGVLSIGFPFGLTMIGVTFFQENKAVMSWLARIAGFTMMFLVGCLGFVSMIRKGVVQIITIHGGFAQLVGALIWIMGWGGVVLLTNNLILGPK